MLKESTVYYMNSMLTSVVTEGGGGEAAISGMTVAGKTGTTDSKYDRWFVGYTPYYTAAVWVGYEINEYVSTSGINPAAQVWEKGDEPRPRGPVQQELRYSRRPGVCDLLSGLRRKRH